MNRRSDVFGQRRSSSSGAVHWTVYEVEDRVHAVVDVPGFVPREELGFGASHREAAVFVGTPDALKWTISLPTPVEPMPVSVTYNNGVMELVFDQEARVVDDSA